MKNNGSVDLSEREIFARNLKYCLEKAGKTQIDLAAHMGVSSATVSDWVNAKKYPRVDKMQFIADYLGTSLSILREPVMDSDVNDVAEKKNPQHDALEQAVRRLGGLRSDGTVDWEVIDALAAILKASKNIGGQ